MNFNENKVIFVNEVGLQISNKLMQTLMEDENINLMECLLNMNKESFEDITEDIKAVNSVFELNFPVDRVDMPLFLIELFTGKLLSDITSKKDLKINKFVDAILMYKERTIQNMNLIRKNIDLKIYEKENTSSFEILADLENVRMALVKLNELPQYEKFYLALKRDIQPLIYLK